MTEEEILEHSKHLRKEQILKVIARENYGIVFVENEEYEEDMTNLYNVLAEIEYNQAKREALKKKKEKTNDC
ncbi:hypothetical protein AB1L05_04550 [Cytobacillus horneckiae]|uniref:hypothetical protein n=1 Tax=Cytobacillus horneckiae TaxID=549687 RepID=UPI0039A26C8E